VKRIRGHYTHIHIHTHEDGIMKPTKHCMKREEKGAGRKFTRGGKFVQSTLYASTELSH
jgi:hypothetical protein